MARVFDSFVLKVAGTDTGGGGDDRVTATIVVDDAYDRITAQRTIQFAVGFQYTIGLPNMTQAFALATSSGGTPYSGAAAPTVNSFDPPSPRLSKTVNSRIVPTGVDELQDCTLLATVPATMALGTYKCEIWSDQP